MFRSLLIIIIVALALWAFRSIALRSKLPTKKSTRRNADDHNQHTTMVQCAECKTYIPAEDAVSQSGKHFCSTKHLQDWNKSV